MKALRGFASDNNSGVHPEVLKAISQANAGHAVGYGDDPYTVSAVQKFNETFGDGIEVFFVFNGTAANVLGLRAAVDSFGSVLCAEHAHINVDECNAPERVIGAKLIPIATSADGKLTVELLRKHVKGIGDVHHAQPQVVSITQATEYGTVYTPGEIRAVADFAHQHGMLLHMDGARISNAAASLGSSLRAITRDVGVDFLSFGGTKNGLMGVEAILLFEPRLFKNFAFFRKQGMQLASKMRFLSTQFEALLSNELWLRSARHSNRMAQLLADGARKISGVQITREVQANAVFAILPAEAIPVIQSEYHFYIFNPEQSEVRWMCSFDTTEEDVKGLLDAVRKVLTPD